MLSVIGLTDIYSFISLLKLASLILTPRLFIAGLAMPQSFQSFTKMVSFCFKVNWILSPISTDVEQAYGRISVEKT